MTMLVSIKSDSIGFLLDERTEFFEEGREEKR
jgi:hypothetical protein